MAKGNHGKPMAVCPQGSKRDNELNAKCSERRQDFANQVFTRSDAPTATRHFHTFGCPIYVLDSKLAAGQSIPKWHKRARISIYLGRSTQHASSVALVLSTTTGLVSPQFHVAFDDLFETVQDNSESQSANVNAWQTATHFKRSGNPKRPTTTGGRDRMRAGITMATGVGTATQEDLPEEHTSPQPEGGDCESRNAEHSSEQQEVPINVPTPEAQTKRWSARHKLTQRLIDSGNLPKAVAMTTTAENGENEEVYEGEVEYEIQKRMSDPIAFAASADPDTMYLHEAMKQPDKKQFIQAMLDEVNIHTNRAIGRSHQGPMYHREQTSCQPCGL